MAADGARVRRGRGDRGTALVELAMILPFLAALVFGTLEIGRAWVTDSRIASAVAQATRVGTADGSRVQADRDVLLALQAALPAESLGSTDRVVIFRSTDPDGVVPTGCVKPFGDASEIGTSLCNTYTGTTLRAVTAGSMTGFGGTAGTKDSYWPPASRNDALVDPPDYLGVWVRTQNHAVTYVSIGTFTVTSKSVARIQPDLNG